MKKKTHKRKRRGVKWQAHNPPRRSVMALVPVDLADFIEAIALAEDVSVSQFLSELLHEGLWLHRRKGGKRG